MNLFIFLEGQSEEEFCKNILIPYFKNRNIYLKYAIVSTKRKYNGTKLRGGITDYDKFTKDIKNVLNNESYDLITTFIDFYGFLKIAPFKDEINESDCYKRVTKTENLLSETIANARFLPYMNLHEYEIIYYIDETITKGVLNSNFDRMKYRKVIQDYPNIEEINENPNNAPSKRLEKICPSYDKVFHSALISQSLQMGSILKKCQHFKRWIDQINEKTSE